MNHCIVVGAGIIGMMSAYKLIQEGYRVTLVEQGETGLQSSWAGGGILSALHPWRYPAAAVALVEYSLEFYPQLIHTLKSTSGIDSELVQSGALFVDRESISQGQAWAEQNQKQYTRLKRASLLACEPQLAAYHEAILFPHVYQLRTPRLLKALKQTLLAQGVEIKEFQSLQTLKIKGGAVKGVTTEHGEISASMVVLSCGAWTGELLHQQKLQSIPTRPVRGQMLLFDAAAFPLHHVVLDERYYLIPRQDGKILAGSTMEEVGFNSGTTPAGRKELHQAALRLMPSLSECNITHQWAGLRPASPNGIPTIARHPQLQGLYINAGHFRNGVAMALGSAHLLCDLVMGRETSLDLEAYQVFNNEH